VKEVEVSPQCSSGSSGIFILAIIISGAGAAPRLLKEPNLTTENLLKAVAQARRPRLFLWAEPGLSPWVSPGKEEQ
jgi:hypothetical protein